MPLKKDNRSTVGGQSSSALDYLCLYNPYNYLCAGTAGIPAQSGESDKYLQIFYLIGTHAVFINLTLFLHTSFLSCYLPTQVYVLIACVDFQFSRTKLIFQDLAACAGFCVLRQWTLAANQHIQLLAQLKKRRRRNG